MLTTTSVPLHDGQMTVITSSATAIGHVRAVNEDSLLSTPPIFAVADGMGGHARGDAASQAAIAALSRLAEKWDGADDATADRTATLPSPADVVDAISAANDAVLDLAPGGGMISGTTLAGIALVRDGESAPLWMVFNIGDSRVYRWDGRHLSQLSVDHSAVQELVDAGLISESEARDHPDRNVITRAMGARADVDADVWLLPATAEQAFVICSDGLTKELDDHDIAATISRFAASSAIPSLADALVADALARGGRDNVTVVIVEATLEGAIADLDPTDRTADRVGDSTFLEDTTPRAASR